MGTRLSDHDKRFIEENYDRLSDAEMAKVIGVHTNTIANARNSMGIKKTSGGRVEVETEKAPDTKDILDREGGSSDANYWRMEFCSSARGKKLRKSLPKDEWEFYVDEWVAFHLQFEDLTHTEENTVEHLIGLRIRILNNQAELSRALKTKEAWAAVDISSLDLDDEEQAQLFHKYHQVESHINDLNKDYRELLDKANGLYKSISGTREQRERMGKVTRETFWNLCNELKDSKNREKQGRLAELIRIATEKKSDQMREAIEFVDGEFAPQLLDADTIKSMKSNDDTKTEETT